MDLIFYFCRFFVCYPRRVHFGDCHEWLPSNGLLARFTIPALLISDCRFTQISISTEHLYCHSPFKCYVCLVWLLAFWRFSHIYMCVCVCVYIYIYIYIYIYAKFTMRIKPTSSYENTWIYYILKVVNFLHISVTFCDHLQGGVLRRICHKNIKPSVRLFLCNISSCALVGIALIVEMTAKR